jgi:hypothetical protein
MPKKYIYKKKKNGVFEVLSDAAGIMTNTLMNFEKALNLKSINKDNIVFIQLDTEHRKPFDFYNIDEIVKIGRTAAKKHIKEIIKLARDE